MRFRGLILNRSVPASCMHHTWHMPRLLMKTWFIITCQNVLCLSGIVGESVFWCLLMMDFCVSSTGAVVPARHLSLRSCLPPPTPPPVSSAPGYAATWSPSVPAQPWQDVLDTMFVLLHNKQFNNFPLNCATFGCSYSFFGHLGAVETHWTQQFNIIT